MFRQLKKLETDGQVFLEYMLLIGIVIGVMIAMTPFVKRMSQSMVKLAADQIGNQREAEQDAGDRGYLVNSYTASRANRDFRKRERLGTTTFNYVTERMEADSESFSNLGFSPRYDQINQINGG